MSRNFESRSTRVQVYVPIYIHHLQAERKNPDSCDRMEHDQVMQVVHIWCSTIYTNKKEHHKKIAPKCNWDRRNKLIRTMHILSRKKHEDFETWSMPSWIRTQSRVRRYMTQHCACVCAEFTLLQMLPQGYRSNDAGIMKINEVTCMQG